MEEARIVTPLKRAGCGLLSAGTCKDPTELVRTPFCPVEEVSSNDDLIAEVLKPLQISVQHASGLGAFSFVEVFGTGKAGAAFVCSEPCDGVETTASSATGRSRAT